MVSQARIHPKHSWAYGPMQSDDRQGMSYRCLICTGNRTSKLANNVRTQYHAHFYPNTLSVTPCLHPSPLMHTTATLEYQSTLRRDPSTQIFLLQQNILVRGIYKSASVSHEQTHLYDRRAASWRTSAQYPLSRCVSAPALSGLVEEWVMIRMGYESSALNFLRKLSRPSSLCSTYDR